MAPLQTPQPEPPVMAALHEYLPWLTAGIGAIVAALGLAFRTGQRMSGLESAVGANSKAIVGLQDGQERITAKLDRILEGQSSTHAILERHTAEISGLRRDVDRQDADA